MSAAHLAACQWIAAHTTAPLQIADPESFAAPEGAAAFLGPLTFWREFDSARAPYPTLSGKIVPLPDGTPVPYIHSGWGDGGDPVFTLTDHAGRTCAIYTDFMGKAGTGTWLAPPGVALH